MFHFHPSSWWDYTAAEKQALTTNLIRLLERVHAGEFSQRAVGVELLCELHRCIFDGVRSEWAGRIRTREWGEEGLTFGPNMSDLRSAVPARTQMVLAETERKIAAAIAAGNGVPDVCDSVQFATECHAALIKIHPFQDGNGRSTRALMSVILVRCGLRSIPLETPRQEYEEALNRFFDDGNSDALVSLALQLYPWP